MTLRTHAAKAFASKSILLLKPEIPPNKLVAVFITLSVFTGIKTLVYATETTWGAQAHSKQTNDQPTKNKRSLKKQESGSSSLNHDQLKFQRSVYVSTGVGASFLEPENSGITSWHVNDKVNAGAQFTLGADINRHFAIELHSADLGSAGVAEIAGDQSGRINYHMHGGSVLWYWGKTATNINVVD